MKQFLQISKLFIILTFMTGGFYPLFVAGIGQLAFKSKADGTFVTHDRKIVGSEHIGQKFYSSKYFWGRPSATDYSALPSGGSQLSATSKILKDRIAKRTAYLEETHGKDLGPIPSDLIFASASGLDPHITLQAAHYQIPRVAAARGLDSPDGHEKISALIQKVTKSYIFGRSRINVLLLNIALDEMDSEKSHNN
jgi:K+-transporting ATPase ATPase C chain